MSDCHWVRPTALDFMGYSMRTDTHRLVQWMRWDGDRLQPEWDQIVGLELYLLRSTINSETAEMSSSYCKQKITRRVYQHYTEQV